MNKYLALVIHGLGAGALLVGFTFINDLLRYAFSLGAFFIGLRFFSHYDTWGIRLSFVGVTIIFFMFFVMLYTVLAYAYGWPLPEGATIGLDQEQP